jgi:hypothetical protein
MGMRRLVPLLACMLLVSTACGDDDGGPGTSPTASQPSPTPQPPSVVTLPLAPTSTRPPTGPIGSDEEAAAIADLAAREGVDESAITVVTVEKVDLGDGVVGCPEIAVDNDSDRGTAPGGVPDATVRVVLELDGLRYEYVFGPTPRILCATPGRPAGD